MSSTLDANSLIPESNLPLTSASPTDELRAVRGGKSVRVPILSLPASPAVQEQIDALAAGQAAGRITARTWSELSARTGASGVGADVIDDTGSHTDPVTGATVPNAGGYVWNESPAGWRWVRPDALSLKADKTELEGSVSPLRSAAAFGDYTDPLNYLSGRSVVATSGGSTSTLTSAASGSGLSLTVASGGSQRIFVISSEITVKHADGVAQLSLSGKLLSGSSTSLGISIGAAGADRRTYFWRNDGQVFSATDAESYTVLAAAGAARVIAVDETVTLALLRNADGTGQLRLRRSNGDEVTVGLAGIPAGPVFVAVRGTGSWLYSGLRADGWSDALTRKLAELPTPADLAAVQADVSALAESVAFTTATVVTNQQRAARVYPPRGYDGLVPAFGIYRAGGGVFYTDLDPRSRMPFALADATQTLYVATTGSDAAAGTPEAPLKSIRTAVHNRTGKVVVYIAGGLYDRSIAWTTGEPNCDLIVLPWRGGPGGDSPWISSMHHAGLSWTATSGQPNVYQATIVSVSTVYDYSEPDQYGDPVPLVPVGSVAAVAAQAGSYYVDGTTIYVRTADDRAPDSFLRVYSNQRNGLFRASNKGFYIEGGRFEGGTHPLHVQSVDGLRNVFTAVDVGVFCAGGSTGKNLLAVEGNVDAVLFGVYGARSQLDGLNYHWFNGSGPAPDVVEINCNIRSCGQDATGTNNCSTMHDGGSIVRINCRFRDAQNRCVHDINDSRSWNLGVSAAYSIGPSGSTSVGFAAGFDSEDATLMWLDECATVGYTYDVQANGASEVYVSRLESEGEFDGIAISRYAP